MSSNSVDVSRLVEAVAEDPSLKPIEKETDIGWTKAGQATSAATEFNQDVARVFTEERGVGRRLLQHPHVTVTEIRVNDPHGMARRIRPDNFQGGKITAVYGYTPVGTIKVQNSCRSAPGHSLVIS